MIVPEFWSESKIHTQFNGRKLTIKRFGWSDISESDAQAHAESRVQEALETLKQTGSVRYVDHKVAYNGAEGIPIREEIIERHDDIVISRNAYGALCLNTPDVMFADIDLKETPSSKLSTFVFFLLIALSLLAWLITQSTLVLIASIVVSIIFSGSLTQIINRFFNSLKGGLEQEAMKRFETISEQNPHCHMRIYRTTMGYRILFMEDVYDPASEKSLSILADLKSDKLYVQMCRNQNCYRARVSPKPWRIGLDRIRPRPGIWPVNSERLSERVNWVEQYNQTIKQYSVCTLVSVLGCDTVHPKAEKVRVLHDELCRVYETGNQIA